MRTHTHTHTFLFLQEINILFLAFIDKVVDPFPEPLFF